MSTEMNRAADALFPSNGTGRVTNVKFFRGRNREVTAEQLAQQLNKADAQVRSGNITPITDIDGDLTA